MDRQGTPAQSRGYALFFVEERLALEQAEETLFRTLLELRHTASIRFQLRRGRLLLHALTSRMTEITAEPTAGRTTQWRPGVSWLESQDSDLYMTLLYDFCDAINWEWHRLQVEDVSERFNSAHIHVLAVSSIPAEALEGLHHRMSALDA